MIKIIGLLAEIDENKKSAIENSYVNAIERSGGLPLLLPYVKDGATFERFAQVCDGFVFTGGADVDPARYGANIHPRCESINALRDETEFSAFKTIFKTGKPILAICRGAQLVNAALGGTLTQDIPSELGIELTHRNKEIGFACTHGINITESSPLHLLAGSLRAQINSYHHQAIKTLGDGLSVMARADDGIIEAMYLEGDHYLRAYQWHPERMFEEDGLSRRIFSDFVNACS